MVIAYGKFIQTCIDFPIISFAIFMGLKAINTLGRRSRKRKPPPRPAPPGSGLLTEIRDLLKSQQGK